jgi:uncharacterized membrane protein YecN with MAPEG domain
MTLAVTPIYAALLGGLYLILSARVIAFRLGHNLSLGDDGNENMTRRIRAHGNAAEYIPIGVLFLVIAELMGTPAIALHLAGLAFFAGRSLHAYGLSAKEQNFKFRKIGMILTLLTLALLSFGLLVHGLF